MYGALLISICDYVERERNKQLVNANRQRSNQALKKIRQGLSVAEIQIRMHTYSRINNIMYIGKRHR